MIFKFTNLDSAFASATVVTAALVATATGAIADSTPTSFEGDINGIHIPQNISENRGVVVENIRSVDKEGIELSLHLENQNQRDETTNTRLLRNSRKLPVDPMDGGDNDKPVDSNTIDIGVLDNMVLVDTKVEQGNRKLADVDYCYNECGSDDRLKVLDKANLIDLLSYCESTGNCGDCSGDGDKIDSRCPSQIKCWNTSEVTDMEKVFKDNFYFNEPLSCWDVSSVTSMISMFDNAWFFNQNINNWDVSSVKVMEKMFHYAMAFNQPLQSWDVSSSTDMAKMFVEARSFNQPLDYWDISSVESMAYTFSFALDFNQCLSTWHAKWLDSGSNNFGFGLSSCPYHQPTNSPEFTPLCQGPDQQCFATSCEDDLTFRFEDKDLQDCEWVASEETGERCAKEGVFQGCAKTCNPACFGGCYDDPDFQLNGVKTKTCEWVAKKSSERCKKPGVMDACRQTCKCATPEVNCTNDEDFRLGGLRAKNCEWVAKQKTEQRCKKPGVMAACRKTCNPSCGCTDTTEEFEFQGDMITCEDLDISYCDAELVSSGDEFLEQLQNMIDGALEEALAQALAPIHEKLDVVNQRLDAIGDADVVEEEISSDLVLDRKTYGDLCGKKCKKCIDS